jgi:DNA adenine methylase
MKYMGSKARIAKHILPIILKNRVDGQWYVEPFVGGGNIIDKVTGNRKGADSNPHVVNALAFIRDGATPKNNKEFTEDSYNLAAKAAREGRLKSYNDGVYCYALIAFSFGAKWIGGWSRGKNSKGEDRDYVAEQHRASLKQKPLLQGLWLEHSNYSKLSIPDNSIIYCDSPYEGTTEYKDKFDHDSYFDWCREMTKKGHQVFISEYNAPSDFKCIWQQELNVSVSRNGKQKTAIEKLFIYNG